MVALQNYRRSNFFRVLVRIDGTSGPLPYHLVYLSDLGGGPSSRLLQAVPAIHEALDIARYTVVAGDDCVPLNGHCAAVHGSGKDVPRLVAVAILHRRVVGARWFAG